MADTAAPADEPFKEITKEAVQRLTACEAQKREFDLDIREGYFFAAPHRAREIRSAQATSPNKPTDADTLQTGIASELSDDFMTELLNGFMPANAPYWAERKPGAFLPAEAKADAEKQAKEGDLKIFEAIKASNLYEEMPKLSPDPAIGTAALWIDDPRPAESIVVQAIPLHELEINLGPYGRLDDRFIVRHTKNRHVKALLGETIHGKLDEETRKKIADNPDQATILRWGYWRLWDRMGDVVWQHVVMLDRKVVHAVELTGEGACPLIPFRFNPSPEWAYGAGPLIKSLPELRQMDELEGNKLEHVDLMLRPPSTYPDDSFTAIAQGIESGSIYPVRPGSEGAVKAIFEAGSMEPAIYEMAEKERGLRRRFYVDLPQQRGDTPPTATQWIDEMQLALRRFGTPGASFWRECPAEIFLRFKYLLEARGVVNPIKVDGKAITLQPFNPAMRAADMEEVALALRYLGAVMPTFPEEARLKIDGSATMEKLADKMRVKDLIQFRSKDDMGNVVEGIKQLSEGSQQIRPGAPTLAQP